MSRPSIFKMSLASLPLFCALQNPGKALAIGSHVDFYSATKVCAAAWTWKEFLPAVWALESNTCETEEKLVADENGRLFMKFSEETIDISLGSCTQQADKRYSCIKSTDDQGLQRMVKTFPYVLNRNVLAPSSKFWNELSNPVTFPKEALKETYLVDKGPGKCLVAAKVVSGGNTVWYTPENCPPEDSTRLYEVYARFNKLTFEVPTTPIKVKKDQFCSDKINVEKSPSKQSFGRSDTDLSLDRVSSQDYMSVNSQSILNATRSDFACPHGVHKDTPVEQAQFALNWLQARGDNLDLSSVDTQMTIRYLNALALEKSSELTVAQLTKVLALHKAYPAFAFSEEETETNATDTTPESVIENRQAWADIEKRLSSGSRPAVSLEDLRKELESTRISFSNGEQGISAGLSKAFTYPEISYDYSNFGNGTIYTFDVSGNIRNSSKSGVFTYAPGSADYKEALEKILSDVSSFATRSEVTSNPNNVRIVEKFLKFLRGEQLPAASAKVSLEDLNSVVALESIKIFDSNQGDRVRVRAGTSFPSVVYEYTWSGKQTLYTFNGDGSLAEFGPGGEFIHAKDSEKMKEKINQFTADLQSYKSLPVAVENPRSQKVIDALLGYLDTLRDRPTAAGDPEKCVIKRTPFPKLICR